ncbi:MAG: hypothetical protein IKE56_07605 [Lachnospiraceae bacterium]|nr:hypothetical protein [Lachnospiraceae bacterium]
MRREQIEEHIQKQHAISDRKYMAYQETGNPRYLREYERAEELIQIASQALSAADDHTAPGAMKAELGTICSKAALLLHQPGEPEPLLREIIAVGKIYGFQDPWGV